MTNTNYIKHHGIKGMKWGVRRTPAQLGHKSSSGVKQGLFRKKVKELPKPVNIRDTEEFKKDKEELRKNSASKNEALFKRNLYNREKAYYFVNTNEIDKKGKYSKMSFELWELGIFNNQIGQNIAKYTTKAERKKYKIDPMDHDVEDLPSDVFNNAIIKYSKDIKNQNIESELAMYKNAEPETRLNMLTESLPKYNPDYPDFNLEAKNHPERV